MLYLLGAGSTMIRAALAAASYFKDEDFVTASPACWMRVASLPPAYLAWGGRADAWRGQYGNLPTRESTLTCSFLRSQKQEQSRVQHGPSVSQAMKHVLKSVGPCFPLLAFFFFAAGKEVSPWHML